MEYSACRAHSLYIISVAPYAVYVSVALPAIFLSSWAAVVVDLEDADFELLSARSGVTGRIELVGDDLYSGSPRGIEVTANDLVVNLEVVLRVFREG